MDYEIDKNYIANVMQNIVDKCHSNSYKRIIKIEPDRIRIACPICGDSSKDMSQKRGHLYFKNLFYVCYNEGCRATFTSLCKKFETDIDFKQKLNIIKYVENISHKLDEMTDEYIMSNLSKLITMEDLEEYFENHEHIHSFKPLQKNSAAYKYLKGRKINLNNATIYEAIRTHGSYYEPVIFFINNVNNSNKILGIQERNLKSGKYRKFKVYSFSELYQNIYNEELDPIEEVGYNKLSYIYNILNVSLDRDVTILEGYLDSTFIRNSVSGVGKNTDFNLLLNNCDCRFLFDNDNAGNKKSIEYLKKGYKVFVWSRFVKSFTTCTEEFNYYMQLSDLNKFILEGVDCSEYVLNQFYSNSLSDLFYFKFEPIEKDEPKKKIENVIQNFLNNRYK